MKAILLIVLVIFSSFCLNAQTQYSDTTFTVNHPIYQSPFNFRFTANQILQTGLNPIEVTVCNYGIDNEDPFYNPGDTIYSVEQTDTYLIVKMVVFLSSHTLHDEMMTSLIVDTDSTFYFNCLPHSFPMGHRAMYHDICLSFKFEKIREQKFKKIILNRTKPFNLYD